MADLSSTFVGIKSPNPFWLASAPPTDKEYNVRTARATARSGGRTGGFSASTTSS
jgi:dihydroorotate dehydrogenase